MHKVRHTGWGERNTEGERRTWEEKTRRRNRGSEGTGLDSVSSESGNNAASSTGNISEGSNYRRGQAQLRADPLRLEMRRREGGRRRRGEDRGRDGKVVEGGEEGAEEAREQALGTGNEQAAKHKNGGETENRYITSRKKHRSSKGRAIEERREERREQRERRERREKERERKNGTLTWCN